MSYKFSGEEHFGEMKEEVNVSKDSAHWKGVQGLQVRMRLFGAPSGESRKKKSRGGRIGYIELRGEG